MYVGNKNFINLSSSRFSNFIEDDCLYVDKTAFIEHVLRDKSEVLLFTRPRRMGKSLNMDTLGSALKDNGSLGKAVLTGVTRVAKENMFSGLNNIRVYDVLKPGVYDGDFSLTEGELLELVPEGEIAGVRRWYNNMRVGDTWLYNIYSVMNYLSDPERRLMGYWSMSGSDDLLSSLLTDARAEAISNMFSDGAYRHATVLDHQLNMEHLRDVSRCSDVSFYTLAVQAGYLTFEPMGPGGYEVFIPNEEAKRVWARLLLDYRYEGADNRLYTIFADIGNVEAFSKQLTEFVSMVLSYNDFKESAEWVYHVFFLGLVYSLGYECKSNLEAGLGRFDIAMKSPKFAAVIEFKVSGDDDDKAMQAGVKEALAQIDEKEYWWEFRNSGLPVYKIGISCHGKKCLAGTVLHV